MLERIYFKLSKFLHLYHQGNHFSVKTMSKHINSRLKCGNLEGKHEIQVCKKDIAD
jgi:hypothetical protein